MNILNKKKVIIFDLDGTLINSPKTVLKILNATFKKKEFNKIKMYQLRKYLSLGGDILIKNILKIKNKNEIIKKKNIFRKKYFEEKTTKKDLYSGAELLLKILHKKRYKICLCTNKPLKLVKKITKELKINHLFKLILTPEILGAKKPNSIFMKKILSKFKITNNEALYIGDSTIDLKLAKKNNIDFYLFYNSNCDIKNNKIRLLKKQKKIFNNYNLFVKKIIK